MIRRSTWIVIVLALALVAFAYYWNHRKAQQASSATPTAVAGVSGSSTLLFGADEGTPSDIKLQDSTGKSVEIARNDKGVWVLKAPTDAPADQASAEAAATQLAALRVISSVQLGLDVVGLNKPAYTIIVTSGGKNHTLAVGAETPIQDGYYTSLDGGPVRIVDKQGLEALFPMLSQPPYAVTPTSEVEPTVPAPATTETPAPTDTPVAPAATSTP
jgi:hypothetical protein